MTKRIGLALSGGGVRAMIFHAGIVKWLAEQRLLEEIKTISTVSGGSLFAGLIFSMNRGKWPTSEEYLNRVLPELRLTLTSICLQTKTTKLLLLKPQNWRFIFSRSNVLALAIEKYWGVTRTLADLDSSPEWSANGTTAETGRRFRFKQGRCGDYELGYADAKEFKIAEAMAASAAYPLLIGPLRINAANLEWFKRPYWGAEVTTEESIKPKFSFIHIMDGGVYDNLGMEPLFDVGKGALKEGIDFALISDGGLPLSRIDLPPQWTVRRLKRVVEITTDQILSLRVRSFMNAITTKSDVGRFYRIGASPLPASIQNSPALEELQRKIPLLVNFPTNLKKVSTEIFDLLVAHGYQVASQSEL